MPKRWTHQQEKEKYRELKKLYVVKNLTISEVAKILGIRQSTVYDRLLRLKIKPEPSRKARFLNQKKIILPSYSEELAELVGILLGDGGLSKTQVFVHLGNKEFRYVEYVINLFNKIFGISPKFLKRKSGQHVVYFGSVKTVRFLKDMGLVENKVAVQVGIPKWIFEKDNYGKCFLRGFLDTDGSVYKLRFGWQISYRNKSLPLLNGTRIILLKLGFRPSKISGYSLYLTRKDNLTRFLREIGSNNPSKKNRLLRIKEWVGTEVVKRDAL